jgi:TP901 family phage tail tape measure protein
MSFDFAYGFIAKDKFSAVINKFNQKMSKFQEKMSKAYVAAEKVNKVFGKLGRNLSLKVGAPFLLAGRQILKTSTDFERSMNMLHAITGASTEQMKKLRELSILVGQTTIFTARQAVNAAVEMAKAGSNVDQILIGMPINARAAAAAQADLGEMAKINAGAMASAGVQIENLEYLTDLYNQAARHTLTDAPAIGASYKLIGAKASLAGIALKDTIAMLALIIKSGAHADEAARWFSRAITKMQAPSKLGTQILKALNMQFIDAHGQIKPLLPLLAKLQHLVEIKKLKGRGLQELFGTRGMLAIGAAIKQGSDKFKELLDALDEAKGTTRIMAESQMQGLPGAVNRLSAAFEHMQLIVEKNNDTLAIGFVNAITQTFLGISKVHPKIQRLVIEFGGFLTILGPILIGLGKVLAVMTFVGIISGGTALAISGITLAVIGLITAFVLLWKKSERFRAFFAQVGRGYRNLFEIGKKVASIFQSPTAAPAMTTAATPPTMSFAPGRSNEPQLVKSLLNINVRDKGGIINNLHGTSDSDYFEMNTGLNMSLAR